MPINFFKENVRFTFRDKEKINSWILRAIRKHGNKPGEINLIFCTDPFLRKMNKAYLKHDYNTDIITFPEMEENDKITGEIFISIDRVKINAGRFKVSFRDELHRVIIHGILHLLGYDDGTPKEKEEMTKMENEWLMRRGF